MLVTVQQCYDKRCYWYPWYTMPAMAKVHFRKKIRFLTKNSELRIQLERDDRGEIRCEHV